MNRYVPTGLRASGGMGSVVFYRDQNLERQVAVKFLNRGGEHRRLLDELAALQRIRSKHVVEVFDVGYFEPGGQMGIIEEFISGESLQTLLGKVNPDIGLVRLIYQISAGLADIHAVGVVHRDIKPSNIIIDEENIVKIFDFNLSRTDNNAHTQGFVGTPGYASPELYGVGRVVFGESTDVYSMGITIWALINGPTLPALLDQRPPCADAWRAAGGLFGFQFKTFDRQLAELIVACIADDPTRRPSASQVRDRAARVLLRDKHRALFTDDDTGKQQELTVVNPIAVLQGTGSSTVTIAYDGLDFVVTAVSGSPLANRVPIAKGTILPKCCVIDLDRKFFTMDVSHPEVIL